MCVLEMNNGPLLTYGSGLPKYLGFRKELYPFPRGVPIRYSISGDVRGPLSSGRRWARGGRGGSYCQAWGARFGHSGELYTPKSSSKQCLTFQPWTL